MTTMGRGNVCTYQPYEGLYYIDNDQFHVYRQSDRISDEPENRLMKDLSYSELTSADWHFSDIDTAEEWDDIMECFVDDFTRKFPAFSDAREPRGRWIKDNQLYTDVQIVMESKLFYIGIKDNEWSMAVMLIQKDPPWGYCIEGLQARHYQRYLDGIRDCLFNRLDELGTYSGAWTSGTIRKEAASA